MRVEVLVCDCKDCKSWEIVKDKDGKIHLHCTTCKRNDAVELVFGSDQPAHWEKVSKE